MPPQQEADTLEQRILALVAELRSGSTQAGAALRELCTGDPGERARGLLETAMKGELLETRWELEDILDETRPKKAPEPAAKAPEPAAPPPKKTLTAADLDLVYDDPRGLMLHKSKVGDRWFATQVDPQTRQPQTFELHPSEVSQLRMQLHGSPYWLPGAGL